MFDLKKWFMNIKLRLTVQRQKQLEKQYLRALEIEKLERECLAADLELQKRRKLIYKHSWMSALPKIKPAKTKNKPVSQPKYDLGKTFFK